PVHQQRRGFGAREGDREGGVAGDEVVADLVGEDGGAPVGPAQPEVGFRDDEDAPGSVPAPARAQLDPDARVLAQAGRQGGEVGGGGGRWHAGRSGRTPRASSTTSAMALSSAPRA